MIFPVAMPVGTPAFSYGSQSAWFRKQPGVDVFARRELNASTLDRPAARRPIAEVELEIGVETIRFSYLGEGRLPDWIEPVFESISQRWGIGNGWDGHSAKPTSPACVGELLNCLELVMKSEGMPPTMTPLADGGMQAEWHKNGKSLEIVVSSDDAPEYYLFDPATGREEEGCFAGAEALVEEFLETL